MMRANVIRAWALLGSIAAGCAHAEVPVAPPTGGASSPPPPAAPASPQAAGAPASMTTAPSATPAAADAAVAAPSAAAPSAAPASAIAGAPAAAAAPGGPLSPASSLDQVLDALDARGDELKDFTAKVSMAEIDAATGNESKLSGRMWMQRVGPGDARLHVNFDRREANGKPEVQRVQYLLDKGTLIDRDYEQKLQVERQVLRPGQKMDLLKLGEGPFPLPLGQDKADVHRMFDVKKLDPANGDPPGTIHVQLVPKEGTQFQDKFATIDFWVDPATRMPVRIVTQDRNGTTTKQTELQEVRVNANLTDAEFAMPPIDETNWRIRRQPFED